MVFFPELVWRNGRGFGAASDGEYGSAAPNANDSRHGSLLGDQFWSGGAIALGVGEGDPMTATATRAIKFTTAPDEN